MKFTIESFKTSIFRPAEWLMQNDAVTHLFSDLNKSYKHYVSFSYGTSGNGREFFVGVYKNLEEGKLSEDECCCLQINFLEDNKVEFAENFEGIYSLPSEAKEHGINYFVPYWTCVAIQKKITQTLFKTLTSMQDYDPLIERDPATESLEIIKVTPDCEINIHNDTNI